jgi:hypothetical protein
LLAVPDIIDSADEHKECEVSVKHDEFWLDVEKKFFWPTK